MSLELMDILSWFLFTIKVIILLIVLRTLLILSVITVNYHLRTRKRIAEWKEQGIQTNRYLDSMWGTTNSLSTYFDFLGKCEDGVQYHSFL